mgnify:CR=1 FL=1
MLRTVGFSPGGRFPVECPQRDRGITLIELMVTVAIVGILATLAAPAFDSMLKANRTRTVANELMASLNLARSEAMRRGQPVSICRSNDGSNCASSGTGWNQGWIVFINENHSSVSASEKESPKRDKDEQILQIRQNLPADVSVRPNGNFTDAITYLRTGLVWGLGTGTFAICAGSGTDIAKRKPQAIVVNATRVLLARDSNGDGIPEKSDGNLESCDNP